METAAAAMLEAGVGRFSRAPAMAAALLAEMWAPLAVALAALATLPSLLRRLQVIVLRLRSCGKEVIQSHIRTYYSSCDEDSSDDEDESSDDEEADASSSGDEDEEDLKRIGFYDGAADGVFPWGGAVVRTWQGLPRRFSGCASGLGGGVGGAATASGGGAFPAAVRLWGASTASGEPWWAAAASSADEGGRRRDGAAAEADQVVVRWRREHASQQQQRRRRRAVTLAHTVTRASETERHGNGRRGGCPM